MDSKAITITYQALIFGSRFWQKLMHSPVQSNKAGYWLAKLNRKIIKAQKTVGPEFTKFIKDLGEKYAVKDAEGKVVTSEESGLPKADPVHQDAYDDLLEAFMTKTYTMDFDKQPVAYFSHLQKTPMDWDIIEQISTATEAELDAADAPTGPTSTGDHVSALRALAGGQVG